jgi:hypothetical protein
VPSGWVVRVTMPDQTMAAGLPMLYAAMFSVPSEAVEAVQLHRGSSTTSEMYEAIKTLGPLYVERRKLTAGKVFEITK